MLNNPGEDLVLSDGFLDMVERVDECLSYLQSHVRGASSGLCFKPRSLHDLLQQRHPLVDRFQGRRDIYHTVSTMYDKKYDVDQDVYSKLCSFTRRRSIETS